MTNKLFPASGVNSTLGKIDTAIADDEASASDVTSLDFSKLTSGQVAALKTALGIA